MADKEDLPPKESGRHKEDPSKHLVSRVPAVGFADKKQCRCQSCLEERKPSRVVIMRAPYHIQFRILQSHNFQSWNNCFSQCRTRILHPGWRHGKNRIGQQSMTIGSRMIPRSPKAIVVKAIAFRSIQHIAWSGWGNSLQERGDMRVAVERGTDNKMNPLWSLSATYVGTNRRHQKLGET